MSDDDLPAALETEPEPQPVRVHEQAPLAPPEQAHDAATVPSGDAPALRPAARRTPAKKAPARKAPARKAAVATAPAEEAVTPAPAKQVPARAAAKASTQAPAKAPAKKAPAEKAATKAPAKAPAKKAPAKTPATKTVAAPVVEVIAPAPAPAPVDFAELLGLEPAPARRLSGATRFVLTLVALLLAGAVGMGAAALVEVGQETWRSAVTVRLTPGPAPSAAAAAVAAGQRRYADKLPTLTTLIAKAAGVPQDDVRGDLTVRRIGTDQLEIVAETASAPEARALAAQVATTVVKGVPGDQAATVANPGDRLGALLSDYPTTPERTRPSDVLALVVGIVGAAAVLLLAASLALLARSRED